MSETRVGAYGVIVRDGQLLLSHWTAGQRWTLPGGGVEHGEDPADAAIREILEETGYEASLGRLLGIGSLVIPASQRLTGRGDLHSIQIVYEATIMSGELRDETDGSSDEARWVPLADVPTLQQVALVARAVNWL